MSVILQLTEKFIAVRTFGEGSRVAKRMCKGINQAGDPMPASKGVLGALMTQLDSCGEDVILVLPARNIRSRMIKLEIPVDRRVTQGQLNTALRTLTDATNETAHATLYRQPSRFFLDDVEGHGNPVGQTAKHMTLEATVLNASVTHLARMDHLVSGCGARLTDVVLPQMTVPAAILDENGSGNILHIAHGETFVSVLQEHRLLGTAVIPVGFRHFVTDVIAAKNMSVSDATAFINTRFAKKAAAKTIAERALDARFGEVLEWAATTFRALGASGPQVISGMVTQTIRANMLCSEMAWQSCNHDVRSPLCGLLGAEAVLDGRFGYHEPAKLDTVYRYLPRGGRALRWLQNYF